MGVNHVVVAEGVNELVSFSAEFLEVQKGYVA